MPNDKQVPYIHDPFATIIETWRDETSISQPKLPKPEYNLRNQPISNNEVKQNRENKLHK